jgi:hypothetical protein
MFGVERPMPSERDWKKFRVAPKNADAEFTTPTALASEGGLRRTLGYTCPATNLLIQSVVYG